jgi:prevent-host-death family protein
VTLECALKTTTAKDFRRELSDLLSQVEYASERIIVTRNGKPAAVLISLEDYDLIREIEDRIDGEAANEAVREADAEGWLTWKEATGEAEP